MKNVILIELLVVGLNPGVAFFHPCGHQYPSQPFIEMLAIIPRTRALVLVSNYARKELQVLNKKGKKNENQDKA